MVAHNLLRRQLGPEAPTASGLQNSATFVDTAILASATSVLVFDSAAPSGTTLSAPPLVFGSSEPTHTPTTSSRSTISSADPSASIEAASGSSNTISMSTVIGTCVGAFIGAVAFVILAIFFYRRYSRSLKQRSQRNLPRSPYVDGRNGRGEEDRRRSKSWNRLDDKDEWEGMPASGSAPPAREMNTLEPMEKLDMFQKTPSTVSHTSAEPAFEMRHPYSNPSSSVQHLPEARDLLGREPQNLLGGIDSGPTISWASESKGSFLSATRLEGGAMSPTLTMAIPTPAATRSEPHHWESAELVNFSEGHTAEIVTPDPSDNNYNNNARESLHNPFFSGKPDYIVRRRSESRSSSHSRSSRSRSSSSAATIQQQHLHVVPSPTTPTEKGKERVVSIDPFRDPLPKPSFIHHLPTGSAASSASNDRAIRQLLAATGMEDMNSDEVQRRLKAASMQPSVISNSGDSMYTDAEPDPADQRLMMEFPIPPSSSGHETIAR